MRRWNLANVQRIRRLCRHKVHYEQAAQELSHEPEFKKNTHYSYEKKANLKKKHLLYHYLNMNLVMSTCNLCYECGRKIGNDDVC